MKNRTFFHLAHVTFFVGRTHREKIQFKPDAIEATVPKHQMLEFLNVAVKFKCNLAHDDYRRLVVKAAALLPLFCAVHHGLEPCDLCVVCM